MRPAAATPGASEYTGGIRAAGTDRDRANGASDLEGGIHDAASLDVLALLAVGLVLAAPTSAHHSFGAEYDVAQPITMQGVLTKIEWTNPHTHIYVDVKDEQGKVVNWQLEGIRRSRCTNRLETRRHDEGRRQLTVTGWRARDGGRGATRARSRCRAARR